MSFIHANDAAIGNSGYERRPLDFYPTPVWVTEAFLVWQSYSPSMPVWEPACGDGAMAEALKQYFTNVMATDLHDYGYGITDANFLTVHGDLKDRTLIITNPPYGEDAEKFIRQALQLTGPAGGAVAMLLRNEYDCAKERVALFNRHPFKRKIVLTTRPRWIPGSTGAPRHNYAWYHWDWEYRSNPEIVYHVRSAA